MVETGGRLRYRFRRKRTTENARTVFRVTLAYLPLLLFFMLLHSERLKRADDEKWTAPTLGDAVRPLRDLGRALCLHELHPATVRRRQSAVAPAPSFCPVDASSRSKPGEEDVS